jgi:farnesyl-diphosphate farnesyltransferase
MDRDFSHSPLSTEVLKEVSRSFYLSLRQLPGGMRDAAGIGYLLARASDTIADTSAIAVADRLRMLDEFSAAVESGTSFPAPVAMLDSCRDGEKRLLEHCGEVIACHRALSGERQEMVLDVFREIVSGQRLDLLRFGNANADNEAAIHDDRELLDYCDRVAGSVGVFWTRLGYCSEGEKFTDAGREQMLVWGRNYGRALQLVNILRDLPEDVGAGRCYLPGTTVHDRNEQLLIAHRRWLGIARELLADGFRYASSLRGRRLRVASVLPALLAEETMEKLGSASWADLSGRVKISRLTVFRCFAEALLF